MAHNVFEVVADGSTGREELHIIRGKSILLGKALTTCGRELWQSSANRCSPGRRQGEGRKIGLGEVPVIVSVLLGPLTHGDAPRLVPSARLLDDPLPPRDRGELTLR